jgi:hypothetical protein
MRRAFLECARFFRLGALLAHYPRRSSGIALCFQEVRAIPIFYFKTGALNRSATPPGRALLREGLSLCKI